MNFDPIQTDYDSVSHKYLCDNRNVYIAMSELTINGKVPTYQEAREHLARKSAASTEGASNEASA